MARDLEFSPLRNENSGGPKYAEPTNKSGALADAALVGGGRWIRTTEVRDNRFTVCPLWPLGNSPVFGWFLSEQ